MVIYFALVKCLQVTVHHDAAASRRDFITGLAVSVVAGTTGFATQALADETALALVNANIQSLLEAIPYHESAFGIDYRETTKNTPPPSPQDELFAHMLSQGEAEFIENAQAVFEDETLVAWESLYREVSTGTVSEFTVEDLKEFTPQMLARFGLLDHRDEKYDLLWSYGSKFISETA